MELPPPATVSIRVVDTATWRDAEISELHWRCEIPEKVNGWSVATVEKNVITNRFDFQAPLGKIEISAPFSQDYQFPETWFDVETGLNEFTLEVTRMYSMIITFKDGNTILPIDFDCGIDVTCNEEGALSLGYGYDEKQLTIKVNRPGLYDVKMPEIDGYFPIGTRQLVVESDNATEHVIELRRKP
ncbi:MAG: hypothetical protein KJ645_06255 [Planctomycetes bacterium]|nr:hypothetical protein [Planctomycetota bacterium]